MKKFIGVAMVVLAAATVSFGAAVGIAAALNDDGTNNSPLSAEEVAAEKRAILEMTKGDQIPVTDSSGETRGYVSRDSLFADDKGTAQEGLLFVPVHDAQGALVGYYGNMFGFVGTNVAEAPGFSPENYAHQLGIDIP
jgi:hypothetical protein